MIEVLPLIEILDPIINKQNLFQVRNPFLVTSAAESLPGQMRRNAMQKSTQKSHQNAAAVAVVAAAVVAAVAVAVAAQILVPPLTVAATRKVAVAVTIVVPLQHHLIQRCHRQITPALLLGELAV